MEDVSGMGFVKDVLRGIAIGIANIIPGVSGGTMMVSLGIYDEVIHAVTGIFRHMADSVKLLLPYVMGMGIGIVSLSFAIDYLFSAYPLQTALLFIGLIYGGVPLILPKVWQKAPSPAELCVCVVFFSLIVWMEFWGEGTTRVLAVRPQTMAVLFLVGALAAATMVIPGVSGSMLLMTLGFYTPIIEHMNACIAAFLTLDFDTVWYCMGILMPFGCGIVLGIFAIAKLVEYLLSRHERMTYFAILGLVLSSPVAVLSGIEVKTAGAGALTIGILMFVIGTVAAILLGKTQKKA